MTSAKGNSGRRPAGSKPRASARTRTGATRSAPKPRSRTVGARGAAKRPNRRPGRRRLQSAPMGWVVAFAAVAVGLAVIVAVVTWGPELVRQAQVRDSTLGTAPHAAVEGPGIPAVGSAGTAPAAITDRVDRARGRRPRRCASVSRNARWSAYAGRRSATAQARAECGIAWNTLAALGSVESGHGTIFGGALDDAGRADPAIVGPALTGTEFDAVPTRTAALRRRRPGDRAVGPMQLIPSTWQRWGADGNGDGVADPQQIDDAALAAAHYLCPRRPRPPDRGGLGRRDRLVQRRRLVPREGRPPPTPCAAK